MHAGDHGAGGGAGAGEPRLLRCSGCARWRRWQRSPGQGGRRGSGRAAGGMEPRSPGCRGLALGGADRARRRPLRPRAGGAGQHLGPPGRSGVRRRCARTGERRCFVCWLPGGGEALLSPPFDICHCVTCWGQSRCAQK